MKYHVTVEGEDFEIEVSRDGQVWVNRRPLNVDFCGIDASHYLLLLENRSYETYVEWVGDGKYRECVTTVSGRPYRALLRRGNECPGNGEYGGCGSTVEVRAPLPGLLVALPVKPGQRVAQGEVVAVLESMKMNLELRAPRDGVVQSLNGTAGSEVNMGEALVVIGPDSGFIVH
jgi:biotin carboxyl carrier protein